MGNSKIDYFGKTLIDLTQDSVTPEALLKGYTAHNSAGELITGALEPISTLENALTEANAGNTSKLIGTGVAKDLNDKITEIIYSTEEPTSVTAGTIVAVYE